MIKVPDKILKQVQQHASQCRGDREVVGILGIRDGVAVAYAKARNATKMPDRFVLRDYDRRRAELRLPRGCEPVLCHSHPSGSANPSWGDLNGASVHWLGKPYAIYSVRLKQLKFHYLSPNRDSFAECGSDDWQKPYG